MMAKTTEQSERPRLGMMAWYATEGGRKCPMCGRYAKEAELGSLGGYFQMGRVTGYISAYGHLPGYGCNRPKGDE
jgi:hypothetical protein